MPSKIGREGTKIGSVFSFRKAYTANYQHQSTKYDWKKLVNFLLSCTPKTPTIVREISSNFTIFFQIQYKGLTGDQNKFFQ